MKSIIYRNPVISAIFINFMTFILLMYSINQRKVLLTNIVILTGVINRRLLNNGININKQKKKIILLSFLITVGIAFIYSMYIYRFRLNQIININN